MNHLREHPDGTFEVRISVPQDCRDRIGKATLTKRLGRVTKSQANALAAPVVAAFKEQIRQARFPDVPPDSFHSKIFGQVRIIQQLCWAGPPPQASITPAQAPATGKTVEDLITAYEAAKSPKWGASSKKAVAPVFRVLRDVFPSRDIASITREEARGLVKLLEGLPTNLGKRTALKGLTVPQAVEKARELGLPVINPKTLNDAYLLHIASMWNWAVKETWLAATPFSGLAVHDPVADEDRRDAFTVDQLNKLFRKGPWVSPWAADRKDPAAYWIPLLCLFHGLRLAEAAGLRVQDITEEGEVALIHILAYEGRALKTKGARGTLPVHPTLIRLGFMRWVENCRGEDEAALFPEVVPNARGQIAVKQGRDFVAFVKRLELSGKRLGIHSFRHNFEDALREAELPDRTALAMARRAETGSSRVYGAGLSARAKREAMDKIIYPGLDLSHLGTAVSLV